jgi:hypothetical protein
METESGASGRPNDDGRYRRGGDERAGLQQRIIDHEARLSRAAGLVHDYQERQRARAAARLSWEQSAWLRRQLAQMIAESPRDELHALGLTDEMVRESRLGDTLQAAWDRSHTIALRF